ncbi:hypothetical protein LINGRAHAP2_LOCUS6256 [Linum grandiflorum]
MEEFRRANDQMYNNVGEWKYEPASSMPGDKHVFSRNISAVHPPPARSNKMIVVAAPPPRMVNHHKARARRSEGDSRRQKRVVKYKSYAYESRVRASLNSGLRWFKNLL